MHSKLLWWLSLLGVFASFTVQASAQQQAGKIQAARVTGAVTMTVKATNLSTPVNNASEIYQGSIVTTARGASVVLIFNNGATVNLGADSALDIEQFTQEPFTAQFNPATATDEPSTSTTKLKLTHGELVGKVAKLKTTQGSSFSVNTPVGAAGIRGTTFRIVYRPDGNGRVFFSLTTLEGDVEVTLATGTVAAPVSVTDNQEVVLADVAITVDASGNVTVTLPTGVTTVIPTTASTTTMQDILASAQVIAEAVATVVITSPPPTNTNQDPAPDTTPPPKQTDPFGG